MPKVKVPGAHASSGVKAPDFTLPKGDYVFEIIKFETKESEKSACLIHTLETVVIDGPDTDSGKTTQSRKFTHRIIQLLPDHDSYNASDTRAADEIKDLCAAADVELDDDDEFDTDDFSGQKVKAKLGIRMGKDVNGEQRPENTVLTQKGEDGATHLWLSDDGKPSKAKPAPKAAGAKAPAGKRR